MKISVSMMVKDEATNLPRLLESVKKLNFADEIVIIDTGSTDNTIEIAESFGATVFIPDNLDDYFIDTRYGKYIDFGKTRNLTIEKSSGDWLLLLDADEELTGDASQLKSMLLKLDPSINAGAIFFQDRQKGKNHVRFPQPRIFKKGKIKFEEIVHNRPIFKEPAILIPGLEIKHFGYDLTPEQKEEKSKRTLGLLERRLVLDPTDYQVYFYMAQLYGEKQTLPRCIEYCIKYIRNKDLIHRFNPSIYFTLVQACIFSDNKKLADKWLGEAIRELPDDIDIAMAILDFGIWMKKPLVVLEGANRLIRNYDAQVKNPLHSGSRFVYNFSKEALIKALFHISTMRLQEGSYQLERLKKELPALDAKKQKAVNGDLAKVLGDFGVSWIHKEAKGGNKDDNRSSKVRGDELHGQNKKSTSAGAKKSVRKKR
jgi:glycosyltransferase involved in cell wall biosynthesis